MNRLRIDDLDLVAMREGCMERQLADLTWLGLAYDESPIRQGPVGPYRQSQRMDHYAGALSALNEKGLLYPCWCSRKEVLQATIAPHASDEGPIYPGTCRPQGSRVWESIDELPSRKERKAALRINTSKALQILRKQTISFRDEVAGNHEYIPNQNIDDFVVRRVDGLPSYQLACAYDDATMHCSEVLRGRDLLMSTARQVLILDLLGFRRPVYAHVGLVRSPDGRRLSKRAASTSLSQLREAGIQPGAVIRLLAALSGLPQTADLDHLTEAFELSKMQASDVDIPTTWIEDPRAWKPC